MRYILFLSALVGAVGCVSVGRPLPPSSVSPTVVAQAQDIPIVPLPPPPLSNPNEKTIPATPTSIAKPANDLPAPPAVVDLVSVAPTAASNVTARQLYQTARDRFQGVDSYIVRLIRREMVKGEMNPEEVILFKFRNEPWSVSFKWLSKEGLGREVVYVKGRYEGKIHSLLAAGDIPFMPAGKRMALAPDSILVKSATRHPISQAGIAAGIEKIGEFLTSIERGDRRAGSIVVVGPLTRPEFDKPAHAIEHTLAPGFDPSMPNGGKRTYFFDPNSGLPTLITAKDERGQEVEYYRYDRLESGVKLDDDDFNPDVLWARPKETASK